YDLDDRTAGDLFVFSKKVAKAIQKAVPCKRIGVTVIGLEVPHAHIHLIPINQESDMNFSNKRQKFSPEELMDIAEAIARNF
ncbi:MAG: HIT family protein, partial [Dysgonamonadaceae bacterium]|nr:HIT family protein [Dysgonamonadaceae bacterium]MDR0769057.1 HIT family protein [Dysgonamonadaceae bacterium]